MQGAVREIKEETGCDVQLTGVATITNRIPGDDIFIFFTTKLLSENIKVNKDEILDAKWFSIDDILYNMDDKLRNISWVKQPIKNIKDNKIGTIDIVNLI